MRAFLQSVGNKRCDRRAGARQWPEERSHGGAAAHRLDDPAPVVACGQKGAHRDFTGVGDVLHPVDGGDDFGNAEHSHREDHDRESVVKVGNAERVSELTRVHVDADQAQHQAEHNHGDALDAAPAADRSGGYEAEQHRREVLRRLKAEREARERRSEDDHEDGPDRGSDEGCDRGYEEGGTCATLTRHRIAVEARDRVGCGAGEV